MRECGLSVTREFDINNIQTPFTSFINILKEMAIFASFGNIDIRSFEDISGYPPSSDERKTIPTGDFRKGRALVVRDLNKIKTVIIHNFSSSGMFI